MFIVCRHYGCLIWKNWRAHTQNEWIYILFLFKLSLYLRECLIHHLGLWDWKGWKGKKKKKTYTDSFRAYFSSPPFSKWRKGRALWKQQRLSFNSFLGTGLMLNYQLTWNFLLANLVLNTHKIPGSCYLELAKAACKRTWNIAVT